MRVKRTMSGVSRLTWSCPVVVLLAAVLGLAQQTQQNGQQSSSAVPASEPGVGREWTASGQVQVPMPPDVEKNADQVNAERRKQIAEESAQLVKLATDLKAEVDKTSKDTLSLGVIRKAEEIEKLAHSVKEKMKVAPGNH